MIKRMQNFGKEKTLALVANEIKKRQREWTAKGDPITEKQMIDGLKEDWAVTRGIYQGMGIKFEDLVEAGKKALNDNTDLMTMPKGFDQTMKILEKAGGTKIIEKIGRNQPCPCGSGKKYKKCCGR